MLLENKKSTPSPDMFYLKAVPEGCVIFSEHSAMARQARYS